MKRDFSNVDGWKIIPSHLQKHPDTVREPINCWLVTLTLTSGRDVEFYVTARTIFDAQKKADEYSYLADFEHLVGKFKLLP